MRLLVVAIWITLATVVKADESSNILVSIKPIHSLVASVMGDTGSPALILKTAQSPHHMSLKPSMARALQEAKMVFWIGPDLEAFLTKPLKSLSGSATIVSLAKVIEFHSDSNVAPDMHIWLSPEIVIKLVDEIKRNLMSIFPNNSQAYETNAEDLTKRISALSEAIRVLMAPYFDTEFLTLHNAYGHFNKAFGLNRGEPIEHRDQVGAKRVAKLRSRVTSGAIGCVMGEEGENGDIIATLIEGTGAKTARLDSIGKIIEPGPDLYETLMRTIAEKYVRCLN